jgi:hypothetical protein
MVVADVPKRGGGHGSDVVLLPQLIRVHRMPMRLLCSGGSRRKTCSYESERSILRLKSKRCATLAPENH